MILLNNEITDFYTDIQEATTSKRCGEILLDFYFERGAIASHLSTGFNLEDTVASNYDMAWRSSVYQTGRSTKHHVYKAAIASMCPVLWGIETNHEYNQTSSELETSAYDAFGAKTAVVFPFHSDDVMRKGCASYVSEMGASEFNLYMKEKLVTLQSAAIFTYTKAIELAKPEKSFNRTPLAPREKECLIWLAAGKRTKQIADKLNLREVTVNLYIQNAKKKLRASSREQLIAIAVQEGRIQI